ncbi:efflux RND transporter periplasmic adaptor subunit [Adhaeribacter radiodurans]|uniref:Efflux RND transporter periplasmic adaptor subunit n=1 Tax=Adhaeribacter radiodurans TaxID=2745197 RepID=A0A7L7L1Q0_9BACT|nr:efflux RND transporter periplasmic adaptor subunit [Adhaeribacter radiodurans]QMU26525.1 efflux RND transporter periplasmic adaptor subunit [Adhaeribacter radiodurans]
MKFKIYIVVISLFLISSCTSEKAGAEKEEPVEVESAQEEEPHEASETAVELTPEQFVIGKVELGKIAPKNLSNVIAVNGLLDVPPQNLVSVSVPLGGFVQSTDLLQGMRIKKGQLVAVIENPEFVTIQQDYLESTSQLEYLTLEYERQKELAAEKVGPAKNFQQVTAQYKAMQSRVNGLKQQLAHLGISASKLQPGNITRTLPIHSPINGYVTEVNTNRGSYVTPTDVLFKIVDTEHLHVELTVFEKDITKLKVGQKIRFTLPNESGRERMATLHLIGREISPERTVRVHAHLDKEEAQLIPGMYVKAFVELNSNTVPALPQEAVVQSEGKDYIFVFKGERQEKGTQMRDFQMVEIRKGVTESGYTEIVEPAAIKDLIAVKGAYSLLAKIKNTEEEGEGHGH